MPVRDRVKRGVRSLLARFSGEYSAAAPPEITPFERNIGEDPAREVVRAQLHRPKGRSQEADD